MREEKSLPVSVHGCGGHCSVLLSLIKYHHNVLHTSDLNLIQTLGCEGVRVGEWVKSRGERVGRGDEECTRGAVPPTSTSYKSSNFCPLQLFQYFF